MFKNKLSPLKLFGNLIFDTEINFYLTHLHYLYEKKTYTRPTIYQRKCHLWMGERELYGFIGGDAVTLLTANRRTTKRKYSDVGRYV